MLSHLWLQGQYAVTWPTSSKQSVHNLANSQQTLTIWLTGHQEQAVQASPSTRMASVASHLSGSRYNLDALVLLERSCCCARSLLHLPPHAFEKSTISRAVLKTPGLSAGDRRHCSCSCCRICPAPVHRSVPSGLSSFVGLGLRLLAPQIRGLAEQGRTRTLSTRPTRPAERPSTRRTSCSTEQGQQTSPSSLMVLLIFRDFESST